MAGGGDGGGGGEDRPEGTGTGTPTTGTAMRTTTVMRTVRLAAAARDDARVAPIGGLVGCV